MMPAIPTAQALVDIDCDAHAGVEAVVHVVAAVGVDHVDVVRIAPRDWPRINEAPCVAAVNKAVTVIFGAIDVEAVLAAEVRLVMRVRNAAMVAVVFVTVAHVAVIVVIVRLLGVGLGLAVVVVVLCMTFRV